MNRFFHRLGIFIKNKHIVIFILGLLLIVPAILGAMQLEMKTGNETYVSTDSEAYKNYEQFTQRFSDSVVILLLTADNLSDLVQQDNMAAMQAVETNVSAKAHVVSAIGPAFLIKQAVAKDDGSSELPTDTQAILEIITDTQSGTIRSDFSQVFPDERHAFIAITIDSTLSQNGQTDLVKEIKKTVAEAGFGESVSVTVTGLPATWGEINNLMEESMRNMLILSVVLMLVILVVIFNVRGFFAWRWLPLGVVFLGIIYALGAMGIISIPITMVTMSVFPILIGLGVDYAIQFHNRYDEEIKIGKTAKDAIMGSVSHIGPTIGIAIVAACLGFVALFFSPVPMIQDFGLTLIIGIVVCYVLSIFFLLAILYWHDKRSKSLIKTDETSDIVTKKYHFVDRLLCRIAPSVIKNPAVILTIALLLTAAGLFADHSIKTETDQVKFMSQDIPLIEDLNNLKSLSGGITSTNLLVEAQDITDPTILEWMWQIEQRINEEQSDIVAGTSSIADIVGQANGGVIPQDSQEISQILEKIPVPIKRNLITNDLTAANIIVTNREIQTDVIKDLAKHLKDYTSQHPDGVNVTVTGNTEILVKLGEGLTGGRQRMTLIGIILVFAGLLLLLKFKLLRALIAIVPMLLIIGWSSGMMYLLGMKYTPLTATLAALIIGIGVEFTILLMMRYYEERDKGNSPEEAMATSIARIGRAIIASGFTVIGGFGALLIATDFPLIRDFGLVTMFDVFFALVTTLVVLPPLIVWLDSWRERKKTGSAV